MAILFYKDIISHALEMKPGEVIQIPCSSKKEMERVRVSIYREIKSLHSTYPDKISLLNVSRQSGPGERDFQVLITKQRKPNEITLLKEDGTSVQIPLGSGSEASVETELERVCKLMKEDGADEDTIEKYRKDYLKESGKPDLDCSDIS